jgi:hypothetical protein
MTLSDQPVSGAPSGLYAMSFPTPLAINARPAKALMIHPSTVIHMGFGAGYGAGCI